jgi:23S rRNA (uracil1939-C5)-methyltransferase
MIASVQAANGESVVELEIESIASGGNGVGRESGMVVFVPRSATGDRVRARVPSQSGKRFAVAELVEVVRPSPHRVDPPCPHYRDDRCGGCQLQHLSYAAQLEAKRGIVRDTLTRIGKRAMELPTIRSSDRELRYRAKLTLAMRRRDGRWLIGLHPYDDPVAVFQLRDCLITDDRVVATWREIFAAADLLPNESELRASVRLVASGAAITVAGGSAWESAERFLAAVPSAAALWWKPENQQRRLVTQRSAAPGGASFSQINSAVAAALTEHVVTRAQSHAPKTVVDAYAGTGDTAVPLAEAGARVVAIELDREASAVCAARLPHGSRAETGRVEDLLKGALPADVVILNPPRAGVHARVTSLLQRLTRPVRAVIYVSCDPATLARDLARMPRYRVTSVVAFDMFPQTAHVETVCELVPEAA